ncbi:MAG: hypothetical protein R3B06_21350 [Kofleriaceae bacterium]
MTRAIAILSLLMLVAACKSDKSPWTSNWSEQERIAWVAACADVSPSQVTTQQLDDDVRYWFEYDRAGDHRGGLTCSVRWNRSTGRVASMTMAIDTTDGTAVAPAEVTRLMALAKSAIPPAAYATLEKLSTGDALRSPSVVTEGLRISAGYAAGNTDWGATIVAE